MKRREFLKAGAAGTLGVSLGFKPSHMGRTHMLTFSFDDGFKKSFLKLADIHEEYGYKACLNVIASGHFKSFQAVDDWILPELMGNFDDWNYLIRRGHEVMPHSWQHLNLARQDPFKAKELISKCIVYFNEHLTGFDPEKAVFNYPFNASTDELNEHALQRVRAVRTWADGHVNPMPSKKLRVLGCASNGPDNIDGWVKEKIDQFLKMDGGWMILNLHGLDDEGWGPVSTDFFDSLLQRLRQNPRVEIIPAGMALDKYGS